jgi:hypothetical protein
MSLLAIVVTMFMLDTVLWIFDIHDLILEVSTVLTSASPASLQDKYADAAFTSLFPLAPVFYTFMVRAASPSAAADAPTMPIPTDCIGRHHHHLARLCVLVPRARPLDARAPAHGPRRVDQYV